MKEIKYFFLNKLHVKIKNSNGIFKSKPTCMEHVLAGEGKVRSHQLRLRW